MHNPIKLNGKVYISSRQAGKKAGYATDYIGQLCRSGKLDCTRLGRVWYVTEESLLEHKRFADQSLSIQYKIQESTPPGQIADHAPIYGIDSQLSPLELFESKVGSVESAFSKIRASTPLVYSVENKELLPTLVKKDRSVPPVIKHKYFSTDFSQVALTAVMIASLIFGVFTYASDEFGHDPLSREAVAAIGTVVSLFDSNHVGDDAGVGRLFASVGELALQQSSSDNSINSENNLDEAQQASSSAQTAVQSSLKNQLSVSVPSPQTIIEKIISVSAASSQSVSQPTSQSSLSKSVSQSNVLSDAVAVNLEQQIQDLDAKFQSELSSQLASLSSGGAFTGAVSSNSADANVYTAPPVSNPIDNVYQEIAESQNISQLSDTTITNPTINGGTISGSSITGGSMNVDSVTANSASVTGALSAATITGDTLISTGDIGAGTSTPSDVLAVAGPVFLASTTAPSGTDDRLYNFGGQLYWNGTPLVSNIVSSQWTTNGSNLYFAPSGSVNVGIGTTSPWAALSVEATAGGSAPLFTIASSTGGAPDYSAFYVAANGFIGVGTTTPTRQFEVAGAPGPYAGVGQFDIGNGGFAIGNSPGVDRLSAYSTEPYIRFLDYTNSYASLGVRALSIGNSGGAVVPPTSGLYVQGNIGIGTTSPWAALSVQAPAGGSAPLFTIASSTNGLATSTALFVAANGYIGIGTSTPSTQFEVSGNGIKAGIGQFDIGNNGFAIGNSSGVNRLITYSSEPYIRLLDYTNSYSSLGVRALSIGGSGAGTVPPTNGLYVQGNIGIGTTSPYAKLSVENTASGNTTPLFTVDYSNGGLATSTALFVAANGSVGIGTTSPGSILSILGVGNFASATSTLFSSVVAPYFNATSTTVASNFAGTLSTNNLIANSLITKNTPVIDVRAYGAKGDGVTDDTTAIQSAVTAAPNGSVVYFPATGANYMVSGTISFNGKTDVSLVGENGSEIQVVPGGSQHYLFQIQSSTSTRITGLTFDGDPTLYTNSVSQLTGDLVYGRILDGITIDHNTFENFSFAGVMLNDTIQDSLIEDNTFVGPGPNYISYGDNGNFGIYYGVGVNGAFLPSTDEKVEDNMISNTAIGIFSGQQFAGLDIGNNTIYNIDGQHGIYLYSGAHIHGNTIYNDFGGGAGVVIRMDGDDTSDINNVDIEDNSIDMTGNTCVPNSNPGWLCNNEGISFTTNTYDGNTTHSFKNGIISGNTIKGGGEGISIQNVTPTLANSGYNWLISNNLIASTTASTASYGTPIGIEFSGSGKITGNTIDSTYYGAIQLDGASSTAITEVDNNTITNPYTASYNSNTPATIQVFTGSSTSYIENNTIQSGNGLYSIYGQANVPVYESDNIYTQPTDILDPLSVQKSFSTGALQYNSFTKNFGIGTTSPYSLLSLSNAVTTAANTPLFTIASTTGGTATSTLLTVLASGNVGIGTTTPYAQLSLQATAGGSTPLFTIASSTNGLATSTALFVAANGYIGIGTSTPSTQFEVSGNGIKAGIGQFDIGNNGFAIGNSSGVNRLITYSSEPYIRLLDYTNSYSSLGVRALSIGGSGAGTVPPTNGLYVQGNVGIGTTTPNYNLDVVGDSQVEAASTPFFDVQENSSGNLRRLRLEYDTTNNLGVINATSHAGNPPSLSFQVGNTEYMRIEGSLNGGTTGNVGIGTTSPWATLSVNGKSDLGNSALAGYFTATSSTASTFAANVGVATTTTPDASLSIQQTSPSGLPFDIYSGARHLVMYAQDPANASGGIGMTGGYSLDFITNNVVGMTLRSSGQVGIGTTSPIDPLSFPATLGNKIALWADGSASRYGFGVQANLLQEYVPSGANIGFGTGVSTSFSQNVTFASNGDVGIGSTTPGSALSIGTGSNYMNFAPGATSTIIGNLYVNGTLRSTNSYNGDLFFANNFSFTEAPLAGQTQALLIKNQYATPLLNIDQNGNLSVAGDICAGATVSTSTATTSGGICLSDLINATSSPLLQSQPFIGALAQAILSYLNSISGWVFSQIKATVGIFSTDVQTPRIDTGTAAVTNGIEMTDSATGEIYCVRVTDGSLQQTPGSCDSGSASGGSTDSSTSSSTSSSTGGPIISVNGDNPAQVPLDSAYSDLGARITGPTADLNLGITTTGTVDTSTVGTYTIVYSATDQSGLSVTSTRTVNVYDPNAQSEQNGQGSQNDQTASSTPDSDTASSTPSDSTSSDNSGGVTSSVTSATSTDQGSDLDSSISGDASQDDATSTATTSTS